LKLNLMSSVPRVSVIIPTLRRPTVVLRALGSVLAQTFADFEVIVVIDGPDDPTRESLATIYDPRVRVVPLQENVGIARVRNAGIAASSAPYIAFLDDDDEWLPNKLALQVAAAEALGGKRILLAASFFDRGADFERVLPLRPLLPGEALSEFMFCRKGLLSRAGHLQTSTYFVSRALAREVPFRPEVRPQEDFDWLLRCDALADRPFHLVLEPISIYHNEQTTGREGAAGDFDFFWNYVHDNRSLFTPAAFSFYLATWCAPLVKLAPRPWQRWRQVFAGMRTGRMTLRTVVFAIVYAIFPHETRRRLRHALSIKFR
jgi:glycosyltransferase involved in cell wall biosynthesis